MEADAFKKDFRELLCGELGGSGRSILAQDLAKRAPDALEDALRVRGLGGIADFARQLVDDIVPDVLNNTQAYVRTVRETPSRMSSLELPSTASRLDLDTVAQEVRNVFNSIPEGLYSPPYETLTTRDGYTVRKYTGKLVMAKTPIVSSGDSEVENAAAMGASFNTLASYIFGKNVEKTSLGMTTPVFLEKNTSEPNMAFVLPEDVADISDAPVPLEGECVQVEEPEMGNTLYAVVEFSGYATVGEMKRQLARLQGMLDKDEVVTVADKGYMCVIYNGPTTVPFRRKQELLVPIVALPKEEEQVVERGEVEIVDDSA